MKKLILAIVFFNMFTPVTSVFAGRYTDTADGIDLNIVAMRDKWRENFIPSHTLNKTLLHDYVQKLDEDAAELWDKHIKSQSEKLWPDTPLDIHSTAGKLKIGVNLYIIYQRLFTLAKAYKTLGTSYYNNVKIKFFLTESLNLLNKKYYNSSTPEYGNWWHWELGISRVVNNILVLLYDDLDDALIANYNAATRHFVNRPAYLAESSGAPYSSTKNAFLSSGGNRSDAATVVFVRGLLDNSVVDIKAAVESLPDVLQQVNDGDGFYQDHSFIQHKDLPYTGTYGQVLLKGLGLIKNSIAGTPLDFSDSDNKKLYSVINNAFVPWLYEGKMLDAVNGRSISRKNEQNRDVGIGVMNAIALFIDGAPEKEKKYLLSVIKSQLTSSTYDYYRSKLPDNLFSYKIINDIYIANIPVLPQIPQGNMYPEMDRLLYKGNGFTGVVAMHSKRTGSYECINGENLQGQRTADGMTYIYLSGNEDYYNYWPVVNSNYLPGTTSAGKIGNCDEQYRANQLGRVNISWAGGVTLDSYASASMHLKVPAQSLMAKKSWFFTPDMIVMLGQDIKSDQDTVTTIDNRRISPQHNITVDNSPMSEGKAIGSTIVLTANNRTTIYQDLYQQKAVVRTEKRSADWSQIGTSSGKIESEFLTIQQKHVAIPGQYAWAIYPDAANISIMKPNILANNTSVQAIRLPNSKVIYANFWHSAQIAGIKGLTPLSLILLPQTGGYKIAVSSPRRDARVSFSLNQKVKVIADSQNRVESDGDIISINVKGLRGSTYTFELQSN